MATPVSSSAAEGPRAPRRRDREVLDMAAAVFHRRGYAEASVQDIADELGILKGSLYHYIDSKEDLLFRLLDEVHADVEAILVEVAAMEDLPPLLRLAEYVRRQVLYSAANLPRISIYYHDVDQLSDEHRRSIHRRRRAHEAFVTELIQSAQDAGEASSDLDARTLANCVFGTMIWVYRWYRPSKLPATALADTCVAFVLRGVVGPVGVAAVGTGAGTAGAVRAGAADTDAAGTGAVGAGSAGLAGEVAA